MVFLCNTSVSHTAEYVGFLTYIRLKSCTKKLLQESAKGFTLKTGKIPFLIHLIGLQNLFPQFSDVQHRSQISYYLSFQGVYLNGMDVALYEGEYGSRDLWTHTSHVDNSWQSQKDKHLVQNYYSTTSQHVISNIAIGREFLTSANLISWKNWAKTAILKSCSHPFCGCFSEPRNNSHLCLQQLVLKDWGGASTRLLALSSLLRSSAFLQFSIQGFS